MKLPTICNYAVIRFLPYPETEEFVNIGIVMMDSLNRRLVCRVETTRRERVTNFFPELDPRVFKAARKACTEELDRVCAMINGQSIEDQPELELGDTGARLLFKELVKPRESLIRYSAIRTVLTAVPDTMLRELFERYVERQFAGRMEYQEELMQKRVTALLHQFQLDKVYLKKCFSDPATDYQVTLPFVREYEGVPGRAIKPLHLAHEKTTRILEHGDAWCSKLRRLTNLPEKPEPILFVLNVPEQPKQRRAAEEIRDKLQELGAHTVQENDQTGILEFAR